MHSSTPLSPARTRARSSTCPPRRSNARERVGTKTMLAPSERLARDNVRSAQPSARPPHPADARFDVVVDHRPDELARRWARTAPQATVFQTESFLWTGYATIRRTVRDPLLL